MLGFLDNGNLNYLNWMYGILKKQFWGAKLIVTQWYVLGFFGLVFKKLLASFPSYKVFKFRAVLIIQMIFGLSWILFIYGSFGNLDLVFLCFSSWNENYLIIVWKDLYIFFIFMHVSCTHNYITHIIEDVNFIIANMINLVTNEN